MNFPEHFPSKLKRIRQERGLSQSDLERACNVTAGYISRLESGARVPQTRLLPVLEQALHLPSGTLLTGTDYAHRPAPIPEWARQFAAHAPRWIRPDHTVETRMPKVLRAYPRLAKAALAEIEANPWQPQLAKLFQDWWVDSALEALYSLRMTGRTALPGWLPIGIRAHSVICHKTEIPVMDRPHPCLILQQPVRAVHFPQVTLKLAERYPCRVDSLVCLGPNRWVCIEIDGEGHRDRNDRHRDRDLALPVLRLDAADVQSRHLLAKVGEWLKNPT